MPEPIEVTVEVLISTVNNAVNTMRDAARQMQTFVSEHYKIHEDITGRIKVLEVSPYCSDHIKNQERIKGLESINEVKGKIDKKHNENYAIYISIAALIVAVLRDVFKYIGIKL